jgi:hypothetical protein
MESSWIGLLELGLVLGLALGFGVWQLVSLKRDKRRAAEAERAPGVE